MCPDVGKINKFILFFFRLTWTHVFSVARVLLIRWHYRKMCLTAWRMEITLGCYRIPCSLKWSSWDQPSTTEMLSGARLPVLLTVILHKVCQKYLRIDEPLETLSDINLWFLSGVLFKYYKWETNVPFHFEDRFCVAFLISWCHGNELRQDHH